MNVSSALTRNLGPSWGCDFLLWAERWWPRWLFRGTLMAGTWVALAFLPVQRAHSRAYLAVVLGRPARLVEVWRDFLAFAGFPVLKVRASGGTGVARGLDSCHAVAFAALLHP